MSLFTILIPFLVACAAFASIKIIDLDLPETRVDKPIEQKEKIEEGLLLTIFITDKGIALAAKGAILPTTYVREEHIYEYSVGGKRGATKTFNVVIDSTNRHELPTAPNGQAMTYFNRLEIELFVLKKETEEDTGTLINAVYNKYALPMIQKSYKVADSLKVGDTLFVLEPGVMNPETRRTEIVTKENIGEYTFGKLSAYDQLASRLMRIKARYNMVPDADQIRIVGEDDVVFDKVVHIMDICRLYGYPKISLGKIAAAG
jgi:biopolymer transport protein ExbD